ncbi:MAG: hypothetical protein IJ515_00120 [Clostridia bacterium]|nr:hypothetical protein [Clostridia bacterium]
MNNIEIERKYVIKLPSTELLRAQSGYTVSEICQIYVSSAPRVTHRVRSRKYADKTVFTETKKVRINKISAFEDEREITAEEFENISADIAEGTVPVIKTRHTFVYNSQTFEIDVYPQWNSTAIMETELENEEKEVLIPQFIEIVREVTGDKAYSNASMSRSFPAEIK